MSRTRQVQLLTPSLGDETMVTVRALTVRASMGARRLAADPPEGVDADEWRTLCFTAQRCEAGGKTVSPEQLMELEMQDYNALADAMEELNEEGAAFRRGSQTSAGEPGGGGEQDGVEPL